MNDLGTRVKQMLKEKGMTQAELARLVGVKQQTISYICSAESPAQTSRYSSQIANALGINPVWLTTGQGDPHDLMVSIKVEGAVVRAAQIPVLEGAQVRDLLDGKTLNAKGFLMTDRVSEEGFALEIEGESMAPRFNAGDVVVIEMSIKPEPGDYVCALLQSGAITFRRYRQRQSSYVLVPENGDWDDTPADEVARIVGVMVEHRVYRKRRL